MADYTVAPSVDWSQLMDKKFPGCDMKITGSGGRGDTMSENCRLNKRGTIISQEFNKGLKWH